MQIGVAVVIAILVFLIVILYPNNKFDHKDLQPVSQFGVKYTNKLPIDSKGEYIHSLDKGTSLEIPRLPLHLVPPEWNWLDITEPDSEYWSSITSIKLPVGNYCGNVKNQHMPKYCGSCYIFAAVSALEDRFNIYRSIQAKKQLPDFQLSVQHVLNAIAKYEKRDSCTGGSTAKTYNIIYKYGIPDNTCNPYTAHANPTMYKYPYCWTSSSYGTSCKDIGLKNQCNNSSHACCAVIDRKMYYIDGYHNIIYDDNKPRSEIILDVKREIFLYGPIAASISSKSIKKIGVDGIVPRDSIKCKNHYIDHVVVLVGWRIHNNVEQWVLRNSWGTRWGDNGYFYLPIGLNCLGILDYGFQVAYPKGFVNFLKSPPE